MQGLLEHINYVTFVMKAQLFPKAYGWKSHRVLLVFSTVIIYCGIENTYLCCNNFAI